MLEAEAHVPVEAVPQGLEGPQERDKGSHGRLPSVTPPQLW